MKKLLEPYSYHSGLVSFFKSFYRINQVRLGKVLKNRVKSKKIPANGGRIFAFVGGDGAGKTSNIEKLNEILLEHFYVDIIHVGRPKPHKIGFLFRLSGKLCQIFGLEDLGKSFTYLEVAYNRQKAFFRDRISVLARTFF